ncbi:MAG: DUF2293 domain-containing protein [Lentisphaeria bacterium]
MQENHQEYIVYPTKQDNELWHEGETVCPPVGWVLVPPGDPALTRRLKAGGDYWLMLQKRRNRTERMGIWCAAERIKPIQQILAKERSEPSYQRKLAAGRKRREKEQDQYAANFRNAVLEFLDFHPVWIELAEKMADAVTQHAIPVGSGTVARTETIPLAERAEAAVIAWMRHQTTNYDLRSVAWGESQRRELRRELACESRFLLKCYRKNRDIDINDCPLFRVLNTPKKAGRKTKS